MQNAIKGLGNGCLRISYTCEQSASIQSWQSWKFPLTWNLGLFPQWEEWKTRNRIKAKTLLIYNKNQNSAKKVWWLKHRLVTGTDWFKARLCHSGDAFLRAKKLISWRLSLLVYQVGMIIFSVNLMDYSEESTGKFTRRAEQSMLAHMFNIYYILPCIYVYIVMHIKLRPL